MRKRVLGCEIRWTLVFAGGALAVAACQSDSEDCAETQTCIPRTPEAGAGGEDNRGGTAGANGGSSGSGTSSGGSSGSESGRGGTSGGGRGGTSGSGMSGMSGEGGEPTGGTGGDSGGEGGGPDPTDMTPPSIVSVSPVAGATGVQANANIVITFSEPMDHTTTEAAFESEVLPATFSWNGSSTVLTVNPATNLVYAEGTGPGALAREYNVTLNETAEDENGNRLVDALTWNFRTLKRITHTIPVVWQDILGVHTTSVAHNDCTSATGSAFTGDLADNSAEYILVSANISVMPAGATVESGSLSAQQIAIEGDPYTLGNLYAYGTNAQPPEAADWGTTPISGSLVFSSTETLERKSVDVSVLLVQHYAERAQRNNLSQYRLQFDPLQSNNDDIRDQATFHCGTFSLVAVYTMP